jgi:hypothetical protein
MGLDNFVTDITRRFGPEHYAVDLSEIRTRPTPERVCVVSQQLFDALDDYTRSCPTSPSSGRVYKKNLGWRPFSPAGWDEDLARHGFREDEPDCWWIYFVRNGSWIEERGLKKGQRVYGQLHHPFRLVVR